MAHPSAPTALVDIDWRLSRATFGINIGGRPGQGLGTEATRLTLDWAFHVPCLHNVMLAGAAVQRRRHPRLREGGLPPRRRRRDAVVSRGERCDEVLMDAVREDFDSPVLARR